MWDVPDVFTQAFVMEKDSNRFPKSGGWGYALFNYEAASDTFAADPSASDCGHACHLAVKAKDYIFPSLPEAFEPRGSRHLIRLQEPELTPEPFGGRRLDQDRHQHGDEGDRCDHRRARRLHTGQKTGKRGRNDAGSHGSST